MDKWSNVEFWPKCVTSFTYLKHVKVIQQYRSCEWRHLWFKQQCSYLVTHVPWLHVYMVMTRFTRGRLVWSVDVIMLGCIYLPEYIVLRESTHYI